MKFRVRPRRSLFWKLSTTYFLLTVLTTVLIYSVAIYSWNRYLDRSLQLTHWEVAENIAPRLEDLLFLKPNATVIREQLHEFSTVNPLLQAYVIANDGRVLYHQTHLQERIVDIQQLESFIQHQGTLESPVYIDDPTKPGATTIFSAARMQIQQEMGYVFLTLAGGRERALKPMLALDASVQGSLLSVLVAALFSILLGLFVFYFITRRFTQMTAVLQGFASGDLQTRLQIRSHDELGMHAQAFNQMADTIESNIALLKERDDDRRRLISDISHDLRRPLGTSKVILESILAQQQSLSKEEQAERMKSAVEMFTSIDALMEDFFELSKLEVAGFKADFELVDLNELLDNASSMVKRTAEKKNVSWVFQTTDDPIAVAVDPRLLERVLINLFENALHYTNAGGSVLVKTFLTATSVEVSVADTGIGMSEDERRSVGTRFYRSEAARLSNQCGSGLGLAIVQRALQAHGSELVIASQLGVGSTFSFSIPLQSKESAEHKLEN